MSDALLDARPRTCPHPDKCGAEGCHGCEEPVTSRMKPGASSHARDSIRDRLARLSREHGFAEDFDALMEWEDRMLSFANDVAYRLDALNNWVARMPDAGFTSADPRWDWWHERPR